jgi:4'-phosphopantetheinyl transferase
MTPAAVELFLFDLDDALPPGATEWLAPTERERANRFATEALRHRFVAGRATLRRLLGERTGDHPGDVAITQDALGKPRLAGPGPAFNLSHAGRHALLAIGPSGLAIGVDIEDVRAVADLDTLAPACLAPRERPPFDAIEGESRRAEAFLRLWVRKEACLKAIGMGLRIEPTEFAIGFAPPAADWPATVHGTALRVTDLDPGLPGLAAAIAVAGTTGMPPLRPLALLPRPGETGPPPASGD